MQNERHIIVSVDLDAIIMFVAGFSFTAALLAFLWWWYE